MSVLNFSLLRIFQGYLVICCLIINVLCFCCLATAILDYHISFRLSTTFFTFLNFYFFCFYRSIKCSDIIPCFLFVCQHLFSTFFKFLYQHFTFPENKRRRRDLNPRAATNDLLPFQGSPFSQLGYFSKNGEGGIRTHAPLRTNGFQDRLVMTTSIPLHIYNSENRLIELPLCNVRYDITCTFPMSRPYFIFYRFFCFFP